MKLEIQHMTRYSYADSATDSVNEIRLTPRTNSRQSCYSHEVSVEPSTALLTYEDYFGNRVHAFTVNKLHRQLTIRVRSVVSTQETVWPEPALRPEAELTLMRTDSFYDRFVEYLLPTDYTAFTPELDAYAQPYDPGPEGIYSWAQEMTRRIHGDLTYDPDATHVHTTVNETLHLRRGVCQEYAHLMLAVCRYHGVPARYVSGYHFVGDITGNNADFEQASHAWVEVLVPGSGWRGFDPTNQVETGWRYVKLGHGRDYKDIVPVKGIYRGSGGQNLTVKVDVRKVEDD
ncbi:MAG: transglutaminase domain protein [Paenibacillaceae bacterium]|jgi:transglutaminase-like putative cysteine protease|nr:transglutaminase domain protein [Paenibacillaceae bacterium]